MSELLRRSRQDRRTLSRNVKLPGPWTKRMEALADYSVHLAEVLIHRRPDVLLVQDPTWGGKQYLAKAIYGYHPKGVRSLLLNIGCHDPWARWTRGLKADGSRVLESLNDLLLHEFAHEYTAEHADPLFHESVSALGGKLSVYAACNPEALRLQAL